MTSLDLSVNEIDNDGVKSIADALVHNSTLTTLNLAQNKITNEGAKSLANALGHNTTVSTLNLDYNKIGIKGYLFFLRLLNNITSIQNTYYSNHTLKSITLPVVLGMTKKMKPLLKQFNWVQRFNHKENSGQLKVASTHLDTDKKVEFCRMLKIDESSTIPFTGMDPILLPQFIEWTGNKCGLSVLYYVWSSKLFRRNVSIVSSRMDDVSVTDLQQRHARLMVACKQKESDLLRQISNLSATVAALEKKNTDMALTNSDLLKKNADLENRNTRLSSDVSVFENILTTTNSNLINQLKKVKSRLQAGGDGDESHARKRPRHDNK